MTFNLTYIWSLMSDPTSDTRNVPSLPFNNPLVSGPKAAADSAPPFPQSETHIDIPASYVDI